MCAAQSPENRLARETSPYLLQHRDNPVHWWAWGSDALAEAEHISKRLAIVMVACIAPMPLT